MAYDPSDLRLPHWLLRLMDALVRLRVPVTPSWQFGLTRPGVLLLAVLVGLWLAALYSGNNLLYLCGAMLTALAAASIWKGVRLLRSVPPLAPYLPESTEAGESFVLRLPMPSLPGQIGQVGLVDVEWRWQQGSIPLQMRLEQAPLLTGRLKGEKRALHRLGRQLLTTTAPLGLWNIRYTRDEAMEWAVLPRPLAWAGASFGDHQSGHPFEGDELRDLRGYVPGDALSRIHWRKAAMEMDRWSVKRFEQHEQQPDSARLRIDLRLPEMIGVQPFEELLGWAWYWVDMQLKRGVKQVEVVLGQSSFDLSLPGQMSAFVRAMAQAAPEKGAPAGHGGLLLSLVSEK